MGRTAPAFPVNVKDDEAVQAAQVLQAAAGGPAGACPVKPSAATKQDGAGECPMTAESRQVWQSQQLQGVAQDNMMPPPNQTPAPGQKFLLSTHRMESSILRGDYTPQHQQGAGAQWMYPSEQMFYNAMKRKGFEPEEETMRAVVAIHNVVNERAWNHVLDWEKMRSTDNPQLLRFEGKPTELSPKARMLNLIGYDKPFDRHDWIVKRSSGEEVRYVVDFYNGQEDLTGRTSMYIDARPALDSPSAVFDRMRRFLGGS